MRQLREPKAIGLWAGVCAATLLLTVASGCSRDPKAAAAAYQESGARYAKAGKFDEAIIEYRNAVTADPGASAVRMELAEAYLRTGDAGKALEQYVRAADLGPDAAPALKAGNMFLLAHRFDDAKLWAEKILARDSGNVQAQILLAASLAGLNDIDGAVAQIEESIRLDPTRGSTYANLGAVEMSRGRKDAAEAAFKKAVDLDPKSADARLALGNFYWTQSLWSDAERELKAALTIAPSNILAHRALANFYLATARIPEAEPHLRTVYDLTRLPAAGFALADYYTARNDDAAAEAVLKPLAANPATVGMAEVRLAAADYRRGRQPAAYDRLRRVLESDPTNLDALVAKTVLLASERRLDEAYESAALAVEKHKESASALFWLGRVQAARHRTDAAVEAFNGVLRLNPRATDASVALSQLHLASGHADTAIGVARQVVASEPNNFAARLAVARGLIAEKKIAEAESELQAIISKVPKAAEAHAQLGVVRGLRKDAAGAREAFERAIAIDPASSTALAGLVTLDLVAGRKAEALARIDQRLAQGAADPAVLFIGARAYSATGDVDKAEKLLRRIIEVDPSYFNAYAALGQIYLQQGRTDAALAEFERLAQKDARPVGALTLAGMILQAQGKVAESRTRFERALQIDPNASVAANNLAWIYADAGENLEVALELAQRAATRIPDVPEINDTIGWIHYKSNRPAQAIPYFEKSVAKDATNATYHYHLGLAFAGAGDGAHAKGAFERALKLNPNFVGADEARKQLAAPTQTGGRF